MTFKSYRITYTKSVSQDAPGMGKNTKGFPVFKFSEETLPH